MRTLRDMYAYNAWANAQVFAVCRDVDQARLDERAPGTFGTLTETLKHMAGVEAVYAQMLQDKEPGAEGAQDAFFAHDLAWFAETTARAGQVYSKLLANASDAFFDEPLHVPWFDFALTKHDGLLQVLSHSAQHRAQVFSVLGQRGVEVPNVDYVFFVMSKLSGGA
ncbi:MAG TPA: DinB family protein [Ktedonobacterales bacterium]|nr:DinB family protein [Ktedonobacterales bacterium]